MRTLARSNLFRNPESLTEVLNAIRGGSGGMRRAVNDAAARVQAGNEVELENGQADVVDTTQREAVQHKEVTGDGRNGLFRNLNQAATQLRGEGGEHPPAGFRRIADISITNRDNPFFDAHRGALSEGIRSTNGLEGIDRVGITNGRGTETFDAPDFLP